jgi:ADP-glucose pyrophosphorylase
MSTDTVSFLKELIVSIEDETIQKDRMLQIEEFKRVYTFMEKIKTDDDKELLKFLSLGWFIYNQLDNDDLLTSVPSCEG